MTLYRIPISYKPKEEKVWRGECCQTIRPARGIQPRDDILLWAWSGVPYRSKWKWQKKVKVSEVIDIIIYPEGIAFANIEDDFSYYPWDSDKVKFKTSSGNAIRRVYPWDSNTVNFTASEDGIEPATGEALKEVLSKFIGVPGPDGIRCQIIRW